MDLPKPKAILLDWDNTLVNSWPIIYDSLVHAFEQMDKQPWTLEETKERVHKSMRDAFPAIFGNDWQKAALIYQTYFRANHIARLEAIHGALDFLNHLTDSNLHIAIVSNKTGVSLRKEIDHLNWNHLFHSVVGATDVEEDKPSPIPLLHALKGSNIHLNQHVWMIGDSITDMEAAKNAGCTAILYGDDDPKSAKFSHCPPHAHAQSHNDIIAFLQPHTAV